MAAREDYAAAPQRLAPVQPVHEPAPLPRNEDDEGFRLVDWWRVFRGYLWSILALAVIAGVIGGILALRATPIYRADVKLLVKIPTPKVPSASALDFFPRYYLFYETQYEIIRSRAVAQRVVDLLGLDQPGAQPPQPAPEPVAPAEPGPLAALKDLIHNWEDWLPVEWQPPPPPPPLKDPVRAGAIGKVLGGLTVTGGKDSEIVWLSYESSDAEEAALIANAVANAYISFGRDSRASTDRETTTWLADRVEELKRQLQESETALQTYQAQEQLVDTEKREQVITAKLGTLTTEHINAQAERGEAEARYRETTRYLGNESAYEGLVSALGDNLVQDAFRERGVAEAKVAELEERYGEKHPKMIAARTDLRDATRRLTVAVDNAVAGVRKRYEVTLAKERELSRLIDQQEAQMRSVSGKTTQLARLEREVAANRQLYETVLGRYKEVEVADDYELANVQIIDPAQTPRVPVRPNKQRIVTFSVVLGVIVAFLIALLRDHLDSTFRTREDVEEQLNLPVLGVLQRVRGRRWRRQSAERQVLHSPQSTFSEAINDIRTAVLFSHLDRPPKVVLVTSAVAGEGKTTLASNLALSFRARGRTLLIDCDLRKGRIDQVTHSKGRAGLTDVISGQAPMREAVHEDPEAENLFVLTAGTAPPNPVEVVSSQTFARGLDELRKSFDYIVIDGSPVLAVSDSIILARLVDSVLLVVRSDKTTYEMAKDAVKRLHAARIRATGVVLQQTELKRMAQYSRGYYLTSGYYRYSR